MRNHTILISGAGVAGPSLAFWLARYGFTPTIVERAAALRTGGQAVDFRGPAHMAVLERMGLLDRIRAHESRGGDVSFVNEHGEPIATMSEEMASGDVEILRGDLGRILFDATVDDTEYIFGDSVRAIEQSTDRARVTFESGSQRDFDLVIGADGIHSAVRSIAFGPDDGYIRHLGYYVAIASIGDAPGGRRGGSLYSVPGRTAGTSAGGGTARAIFYFASPPLAYDRRDAERQKQIVADVFRGVGWDTPHLVAQLCEARDFYFDSISEVRMPALANGRVALLGDAGYGGTIGGMGTGVAVVAAYVLAGELAAADGDHAVAFHNYETRIHDYAARCQRGARGVGSFMAPRTRLGIAVRNRMLRMMNMLPGKGMMEQIALKRASGITLAAYPA